ncbi:MAG: M15 family metallopeptidase [Burkholderiales bacterium]|nr:M15 family metallopeptidase [Burkholderiales bacterium]
MSRRVTLGPKNTLSQVAKACYDDARLAPVLAGYNGILDMRRVTPGQVIEVPSLRELTGAGTRASARSAEAHRPASALPVPHGLPQVIATFGDIYKSIREDASIDPRWEAQSIASAQLPFAIPLDWDPSKRATRIRCHRKLVPIVQEAFEAIQAHELESTVKTYGGGYNFRMKRTGAKLSTHCWGIAFDLNARTNPMGRPGDMDMRLVELLRGFGFKWGGDWTGASRDPMHFQYCTGY